MPQILALIKLEVKHQIRSLPLYLVIGVACLLAYNGYYQSQNLWEHLSWSLTQDTMMITSLLISLWAMVAAQREQRQRVGAIVDSTPVSSSKLMLGQWLGLCLITIGIVILIHIITVIRAVSNGAVLEFTPITLHFLIIYLPWSLVMVSLGFVLGKYCSIFISIPAAAGFWFVTVVLSASGTSVTWLPGPWAQLLDVTASTASSSSAIFGFLSLDSLMYNRLFFTAVTLAILTTAALCFKPYRENKISKVLNLIEKVKSTPFKFNVEFNFSKLTMEVSLSKRYDVFGSASVRRYLQI